MVWMALTLVTLTAFAGLGLEYSRWNTLATRIQKSADTAALAGAIFLPENLPQATATAATISSQNGFKNGNLGIVVTSARGSLPNQLKVTISVPTHNPWGQIVNYNSTTIVRSAVAEYQLPQNLGSPANSYGNDPESAAAPPQFWGNIFGPSSAKEKGDAIQSVGATGNATLCNAAWDNCVGGVNKDYDANGYFYGIDVPAGAAGALNVQVFDPAFVHVGDNCGNSDANALRASTRPRRSCPPTSRATPQGPRRRCVTRRRRASKFCTGDNFYGDNGTVLNPWTTWTLRAPDVSTWDPTNNPIICQAEFPGVYPETLQRSAERHRQLRPLEDAVAERGELRGDQPGAPVRVVLPAVGADLFGHGTDPGHLLPAGADRDQDLRRGHADRWWLQPVLRPHRPGHELHHDERPEAVRQPEDGHLRQRHRRRHAVLPHPRVPG